jgi:hypothetical protein
VCIVVTRELSLSMVKGKALQLLVFYIVMSDDINVITLPVSTYINDDNYDACKTASIKILGREILPSAWALTCYIALLMSDC